MQARWNPTTLPAGKCEDDEDGGGIPPSSSCARASSEGMGRFTTASSRVQMSMSDNQKIHSKFVKTPTSHDCVDMVERG